MGEERDEAQGEAAKADVVEAANAGELAAGFSVNADEAMIRNVLTLFCEENLTEMAEEAPAA